VVALEAIQKNPVAFAMSTAERSLPIGEQGSTVKNVFEKVKRKMSVEAAKTTTMSAVLAIIDRTIQQLGSEEPKGDLRAAVHDRGRPG
jgi:hypothetical protein